MKPVRYAIYFVPDAESELYRFGAAAIGYDCYHGAEVPRLAALESAVPNWGELTREPRVYGFHATLRAPFRLRHDASERDLKAALDSLANECAEAPAFIPRVRLLGTFAAIAPDRLPAALAALAGACVTAFEPFRAPLSDQERQRRVAAGLDARQTAYLDRWGYPYVFDEFRFHMTLTGALPADRSRDIVDRLSRLLELAIGTRRMVVDRIVLLRQDDPASRFEVVRVAPVGCAITI